MMRKILRKIKHIIENIMSNNCVVQYIERKKFYALFDAKVKTRIFIIGVPEYNNLGDNAILLGQHNCIKRAFPEGTIIDISRTEYYKYRDFIIANIGENDVLTGQGGGNMGDEWFIEEKLRRDLIADFPQKNILIFPQTIFYNPTDLGETEKKNSINFYNEKRITLIARELVSYDIMKQLYPNANIIMTPDMVLSLDKRDFLITDIIERTDLLICLRSDEEKALSYDAECKIKMAASKFDYPTKNIDMYAGCAIINKNNRMRLLCEKMKEFAKSKLVITDRLHGMIFAAVSETPCIVFGNYNYKISGSYEWISKLGYIKFLSDVGEIDDAIAELLKIAPRQYDKSMYSEYYDCIVTCLRNLK